ncbi:MAG: hypothetical protein JSW65_06765 [Candidatus Bipolaricaulota bacterium]|nr:MAG: hypothetical protein JSW65_06765 [Candidatus Bipolaricaulota bacterium]
MLTVSHQLFTHPVPTEDAVPSVLGQIEEWDQDFLGDVLLFDGEPSDPLVPLAVFVHATIWEVLDEAKAELRER